MCPNMVRFRFMGNNLEAKALKAISMDVFPMLMAILLIGYRGIYGISKNLWVIVTLLILAILCAIIKL